MAQRFDTPAFHWGLLLVSIVLNVFQADAPRRAPTPRFETQRSTGQRIAEATLRSIEGDPTQFRFPRSDGKLTVVYVFSPSCPWCQRNAPRVNDLAAALAARSDFAPIIGVSVSTHRLDEFVARNPPPFDVFVDPDQDTQSALRMSSVPQTLLVDGNGVIVADWRGAYLGDTADRISTELDIVWSSSIDEGGQ